MLVIITHHFFIMSTIPFGFDGLPNEVESDGWNYWVPYLLVAIPTECHTYWVPYLLGGIKIKGFVF